MVGVMTSDYEGVEEVARRRTHGGGQQVEGGKMRDNGLALWREADVERRGTHGKQQVDDEKEGGPCGPKRGGGWMTHDSRGKAERKMT
jgi:hypothetical protein